MSVLLDDRRIGDMIYDPNYGVFYWVEKHEQIKPHYKKVPWCNCGNHDSNGYLQITIDGKVYQGHRLAWFLMTGEWPKGQIDHINRDIIDNRFENLRDVTQRVNALNRKDSTKTPGVRRVKNKVNKVWQARIKVDYREVDLGHFDTKEEAMEAYQKKFRELEGV